MDKLEQVKKEIERRRDIFRTSVASIDGCKANVLTDILYFIDSLQEDSKFKVGQSIRQGDVVAKIVEVSEEGYHCDNAFVPFTAQDSWELVEEAKDDLEKEICNYFNNWYFDEEMDIMAKPNHYSARFDDIKAAARHFAEWQKKQMMKNAVDGIITFDYYSNDDKEYGCIAHDSFCLEDMDLKDRDKVKIAVIK